MSAEPVCLVKDGPCPDWCTETDCTFDQGVYDWDGDDPIWVRVHRGEPFGPFRPAAYEYSTQTGVLHHFVAPPVSLSAVWRTPWLAEEIDAAGMKTLAAQFTAAAAWIGDKQ